MSTYDGQYMDNHNFQPPSILRGVETVVNPAADPDDISHHYHEPSEMNAACARALPNLPASTTVTNMHYGSSSQAIGSLGDTPLPDPESPHYQDPDELASVSCHSHMSINSSHFTQQHNTLHYADYVIVACMHLLLAQYTLISIH